MEVTVRPVTVADHDRVIEIAKEGDSSDFQLHYLSLIASSGRLLCATIADEVVGFGGMIPINDLAMVTDLFVARKARTHGVGSRLLNELLDGWPRRMTFSAQSTAALSVYRRAGMQPGGRMQYLSGSAIGGGAPLVPGEWQHDRADLVAYFAAQSATVTSHAVVRQRVDRVASMDVLRLDAVDVISECKRLLAAFPLGTVVTLYAPENHRITAWLRERSFIVTDHDVLCSSEGVELPPNLAGLHPGLA